MQLRRPGLRSAALVLLGFSSLTVGCSSDSENEDSAPTTREVIAQTANATVAVTNRIQGRKFRGSGFFFDAHRGLLITSTQTIWDQRSLEITTNDGRQLHARLAARSPCDDVSVLVVHPKPPGLRALKLSTSKSLQPGDPVIAVGFPESFQAGATASAARGTAAAVDVTARLQPGVPPFRHLIQHQAPLARGVSGGPLIDERGRVLGMNTAINTIVTKGRPADTASLQYAIGSEQLRAMLNELKPAKRFIYEGWSHRHRCHHKFERLVRGARGFTPKGAKGAPSDHADGESAEGESMDEGSGGGGGGGGHEGH